MVIDKKIATAMFLAVILAMFAVVVEVFAAESIPAPQIFSSTHPDQNAWYREKVSQLFWNLPAGAVGISYSLDQNLAAALTDARGMATSLETPPLPEGVSYFHLRFREPRGWSDTSNYVLRIDTITPEPFAIQFPEGTSTRNFSPRIFFEARDTGSGIQKYEVYLNDDLIETINSGGKQAINLPLAKAGVHKVEIKAFDAVGNASIAKGSAVLLGLPDRLISRLLLVAGILLFVIVAFLLLPGMGKKGLPGDKDVRGNSVKALKNELGILQADFDRIKSDLLYLAKFRSSRKIISYIETCRKQGLADVLIRDRLEKNGWQSEDIDDIFKECGILQKIDMALKKSIKDLDVKI